MKHGNEINWKMAGKILSGEATMEEEKEFNDWLTEDNNRREWEQLNLQLENIDYTLLSDKINVNEAWLKIDHRTQKMPNKKLIISIAIAASTIIAILLLSPLFHKKGNNLIKTLSQINSIELQDGSSVEINRYSTLEYPGSFDSEQRTVHLEGEAFFNVKRDEKKPFIIHTTKLQVKVLGTSFNIRAYPQKNTQVVTVKSGIVEVYALSDPLKKITLNPGDIAIYNISNAKMQKQTVTNDNYLAWKTKIIDFKDETLSQVIKTIEEIYFIKINIPEGTDTSMLYTANFDNDSIQRIIQTINTTFSIELTIQQEK